MTSLPARLEYNRDIETHLAQLRVLLGRTVGRNELLTLEETQSLQVNVLGQTFLPKCEMKQQFSEFSTPGFMRKILELEKLSLSMVYLWTPLVNTCGLPPPTKLSEIHWDFEFDLIPDGIFSIATLDLKEKMVLDYYEEDGEQVATIEFAGPNWGVFFPN